jgi:hypothetical protein
MILLSWAAAGMTNLGGCIPRIPECKTLPSSQHFVRINNQGKTEAMDPANPGMNTALLDVFRIKCKRWRDPNDHAITKYIFKGKTHVCYQPVYFCSPLAVEEVQGGALESKLLYAGPLDNAKVVFGVGQFQLKAEVCFMPSLPHVLTLDIQIWDEAGAFTIFTMETEFQTILPTQEQYEAYEKQADIQKYKDIGDASRIAMILQVSK